MIVYLLWNSISGKGYVGQTRRPTLSKRWSKNLSNGPNKYLAAAIAKYGAHSFSREILAECDTQAECDNFERMWIALLDTANRAHGFNLHTGGSCGPRQTAETRQKLSNSLKAYWRTISPAKKRSHQKKCKLVWRDKHLRERMKRKVSKALRQLWLGRSKERRDRIRLNMHRAFAGVPKGGCWNRGLKLGPYSEERRKKISQGVARWWANRDLTAKKSRSDTDHQQWRCVPANTKETEKKQYRKREPKMTERNTKAKQLFMRLSKEAVAAVQAAFDSLERGGDVREARLRLREIERRLTEIQFEYQGGCEW